MSKNKSKGKIKNKWLNEDDERPGKHRDDKRPKKVDYTKLADYQLEPIFEDQ